MNEKLNKEIKENDNELTSVESKNEEVMVDEVVVESSEKKNEDKKSSIDNKKSIKDYLSKDLFADIIWFSDISLNVPWYSSNIVSWLSSSDGFSSENDILFISANKSLLK